MPIYIHIKSNNNGSNTDFTNVLKTFSLQITSVKDELWRINSNTKPTPVDLVSLVNLRSLYLAQYNPDQLQKIQNLHFLTRLSLPCNDFTKKFLLESVLSEEGTKNFPNLRSIGRILCGYNECNNSYLPVVVNSIIQHIDLVVTTCSSTIDFISKLPALNTINVSYIANGSVGSPSKMSSNFTLMSFAPYISCLRLDFYGHCGFDELARLLQRCSTLQRFRIKIKYYSEIFDISAIRQLSPFFVHLSFGKIDEVTKKPIIIGQWSS
ncbi:hypothetical protein I4U23_012129 [Adineta vaga]|nr:hypothetical protein I4U23_012129 [Adineta vaga]